MKSFMRHILFGVLIIGAGLIFPPANVSYAVTYSTSAHGNSSSGVYNRARDSSNNSFARGNCAHCHDPHASRVVNGAVTTHTPHENLNDLVEENLCLDCHDGSVATDNINTDIIKSYGHGTGTSQNIMGNSGRHRAGETSVTGATTAAHVECPDCHNPHLAQTGNHDDGTYPATSADTTQNNVSKAIQEVDGVTFSSYPTNWSNATSWSAGGANSFATATKEYQICFKCHTSANGSTDGWDGNPGGAGEWTDLALEFNPANASYHPVIQAINSPLNANQLKGTDHTWKPGSTMYCSDCHAGDGLVGGPHGSATKWLLVGTYKNWPYTSAANNGKSSGTFAYLTNNVSVFCRNCHPDPTSSNSNNVHDKGDHQSSTRGRCINCHIRVPHGGKGQRLINANNNGSLPGRYYPDGNGGGFSSYGPITKFLRTSYRSYGSSNCRSNASGCSHHDGEKPSTSDYW